MKRRKRALVTGGAGFIGSHLSELLMANGYETVILDNLSKGNMEHVPDGAEFYKGCVTDRMLVATALRGVDTVFHLAAQVGTRSSVEDFLHDGYVNVMGTLVLLDCCRDARIKTFVYSSTAAVYADCPPGTAISEQHPTGPVHPYGISKLTSEMYVRNICQHISADYFILRYFNAYGKRQKLSAYSGVVKIFTDSARAGRPLVIFGDGEQVRDFVHVSDIVRANLMAAGSDRGNIVLNIGSGEPMSINELARIVMDKSTHPAAPIYVEAVEEVHYSLADISKAAELLGYEPRGKMSDLIDELVEPDSDQS